MADAIDVQRARWHERQSFERPTVWGEIGTDADPAALLRAGIPAERIAEAFGIDNPSSLLTGKDR